MMRSARSPQLARTYRPSVSRVGHDQAIESHASAVSQRQRGCEEGASACDRCGRSELSAVYLCSWEPAPPGVPAPPATPPLSGPATPISPVIGCSLSHGFQSLSLTGSLSLYLSLPPSNGSLWRSQLLCQKQSQERSREQRIPGTDSRNLSPFQLPCEEATSHVTPALVKP